MANVVDDEKYKQAGQWAARIVNAIVDSLTKDSKDSKNKDSKESKDKK
ncbi:hypothetical protein DCO58_05275 [Helicobacter saguini]|uniref:Uncharacterized protein n=1 Tax=Helicobacter saguini TaxID=1548018 RepID=A0A6B0HQS7_9HELI|nr:hypothetical protein [Helicobacter saguini]MWV62239.1 hypothetical protein [Helicobacter saguini]MWV67088.1 hypothetical protein [Helicobacter saguini]MWV69438.1 hypothetical protein [Helicobacter saguini]MWV71009.1 hypothetical protein [Helicobacter saguini]